MAKFSEVLGGIAKDLIQLQVTSDLASMDILSLYKEKDVLKYMDIPRFSVSDIKLNLKFAVSEQETFEHTETSAKHSEKEWANILKKDVFIRLPASFKNISKDDKRIILTEFGKIIKKTTTPDFDIDKALKGTINFTLAKSITYAVGVYNKLPPELRKKMGNVTEFRKIVSPIVGDILKDKLPSIKKNASSMAALERDLEIIIEKDSLEKISESKIHEISFNLTPDFIKIVQEEEL